jgi:hypothetical protein
VLLSASVSLTQLPDVVVCGFRWLTALPCPLCGLTRGFVAIGHGELQKAWSLNPFSFPLYGLTLGVALRPLCARYTPRAWEGFMGIVGNKMLAIFISAGLVMHGIIRITLQGPHSN